MSNRGWHQPRHWQRAGRPPWGDPQWRGANPKALAIAIALVQIFGTRAAAYGQGGLHLDSRGYLLLAGSAAALVVRSRSPLVTLVGALAATVTYYGLGYPAGPGFLAALVGVFAALRAGHRLTTFALVTAAFVAYAWLGMGLGHTSGRTLAIVGVWAAVAVAGGEFARVRGAHYSEVARARAEQQQRARAEEERARKELERRQASDERLRIARELHDVLGHHLSLINVQAGVGLHLMDERPEQARVALAAIKHASAEALRETRSVLAALRPRDESAPRAPSHGLADLDDLVAEVAAAGPPVAVTVEGEARPLPPEVDRAAFRIIQEALTNVRRHAGSAAKARIFLGYSKSEVTVRVTDDGAGLPEGPPDGDANGIAGMRERALALGGSVTAGARPDGGFEVCAVLPADGPDSEVR